MVTVTLEKLDADLNTIYTMTFNNMKLWTLDLNYPIVATPLPEEDQTQQILLKIMGNNSSTKYSWTVQDETDDVVAEVAGTATLIEQIEFWRSNMRPVSIVDSYRLTINTTPPMEFLGSIDNTKFTMTGSTPVSMDGSFNFMEGLVTGGLYEEDTPSPANDVTADSPSSGELRQTWTASTDEGSTPVDFWKFQYRLKGSATWITVDVADITFTHTVTGLSGGTYEARMVGHNIAGLGQPSPTTDVVVA